MSVITGDDEDDMGKPYKGPIYQPCSACSAGDWRMEHHDHEYVDAINRRPRTIAGDADVAQQANAVIATAVGCVTHESGARCHVFLDNSNQCQCGDKRLDGYRRAELPR